MCPESAFRSRRQARSVEGDFLASWDSLSPGQKAAVFHEEGPAAVYAGPGSGKTRVVTLRAAKMAQAGKRLLVTTFTNDATQEMKFRIGQLLDKETMKRVHVTTMHSLCLQILKTQEIKFQLLTDDFQRKGLAEAANAVDLEGGISGFLTAQSFQKNQGVTSATFKHDGSSEEIEFAKVWRAYEKAKSAKGLREFDDLILDTLALLEKNPEIWETASARYTHIVVDECQDMNRPQYAIAFLLGKAHKNLMLVGDLDQSLYGFRGADILTFQRFSANPQTTVYELRENYRSSKTILNFADSLIRQDANRRVLTFLPTRAEGEPIIWNVFPDPDFEAIAVGETILQLKKRGMSFKEMAILYRTNAQSEALERNLTALEIPYKMREDGDFYARKEVQGVLSYLNFFVGTDPNHPAPKTAGEALIPYSDEWLLALMNVPSRKLSKVTGGQLRSDAEWRGKTIWNSMSEFHAPEMGIQRSLRKLKTELQEIEARLKKISHAGEAVKAIRQITDFDGWLRRDQGGDDKDNDRIQNIARMQAAAAHYPSIAEYLLAIKKVRDESSRRKAERAKSRRELDEVTLSTGHSAKGLEWRCVFAVGWSEEILPHRKAEDMDEERRIAYVIATRAKDLLYLSSLQSWNESTVAPSRFLTGLNLQPIVSLPKEENGEEGGEEIPDLLSNETTTDAFGGLFME